MKCLKCQKMNPDVAIYCKNCGTFLQAKPNKDYIDVIQALILGITGTALFYLVFPMPVVHNEYLQQLFSGHISEVITGLSMWSLFIIFFKYRYHRKQIKAYQAIRHHIIHEIVSTGIYVKEIEEKVDAISDFLEKQKIRFFQDSIIFRRIRRILHYVQAIPKKEEVNKILDYQAEIDYNRMQSSYTLLNVFIWAIPILGFIGTVFGIGEAVGEFSQFIRRVDSVSLGGQMRSALGGVTNGLSVAFNTTFLALVCVIPIMGFSSFLRKAEEDLLLLIEEYCLEELLPNIHMRPGIEVPKEVMDDHLYRLSQFTENWMTQISPVLESVTQHTSSLKHQISGLQPLVKNFSEDFFNIKDNVGPDDSNSTESNPETNTVLPQVPTQESCPVPEESPDIEKKNSESS